MSGYVCGPCACGHHDRCNGFLRTSYEFCPCSDRAHQPVVSDEAQAIRARNDAIVTEHLRNWFRTKERETPCR